MPAGDTVFQRLRSATDAEIKAIASSLGEMKSLTFDREFDVVLLSKEYRAAAGNSLANVLRDAHALQYKEILKDVANAAARAADWKVVSIKDSAEETWIEEYVLQATCFSARPDRVRLSETEKAQANERAEAALAGRTAPLATAVEAAVGLGAIAAGSAIAVGSLPFLVIGGGASLLLSALGPAMRKVLPATMVLIQIRKRANFEELLRRPSRRPS